MCVHLHNCRYKPILVFFFPIRVTTSEPRTTSQSESGSASAASLSPWCTAPFCWTCVVNPAGTWPSTPLTQTTAGHLMTSWCLPSQHVKQVSSQQTTRFVAEMQSTASLRPSKDFFFRVNVKLTERFLVVSMHMCQIKVDESTDKWIHVCNLTLCEVFFVCKNICVCRLLVRHIKTFSQIDANATCFLTERVSSITN